MRGDVAGRGVLRSTGCSVFRRAGESPAGSWIALASAEFLSSQYGSDNVAHLIHSPPTGDDKSLKWLVNLTDLDAL